jgi:hypothetical protein
MPASLYEQPSRYLRGWYVTEVEAALTSDEDPMSMKSVVVNEGNR